MEAVHTIEPDVAVASPGCGASVAPGHQQPPAAGPTPTQAAARRIDDDPIRALLFRAALLCGHGARASPLADRLAAITRHGDGRSCLDAGSPVQLTIEAPGPARLRVGVRLGAPPTVESLAGLVDADAAGCLVAAHAALPAPAHAHLGTWLFWSAERQSLFVDLRDPSPADALARLAPMLDARQSARLERVRRLAGTARPWVVRLRVGGGGAIGVELHSLLYRHDDPERWVEALVPGAWRGVLDIYGRLLRRPRAAGRWVVAMSLDDAGNESGDGRASMRIGHSGWMLVPEDEHKHRAVGELIAALGGARDHAEAMWSLCRGAASSRHWRVGRACEIAIDRDAAGSDVRLGARLFLAPQLAASLARGGAA